MSCPYQCCILQLCCAYNNSQFFYAILQFILCGFWNWYDLKASNVSHCFDFSTQFLVYLNFFFLFSLNLKPAVIAISAMAQPLSFLFTTSDFLALISDTLDYNIPQNLQFFIANNTFWTMFIPFFTDFHIVFSTQFPTNYS